MKDFMCALNDELAVIKAKNRKQIWRIVKDDYKHICIIPKEDTLKLQVVNNKLVEVENDDTFEIHKLRKITYEIYKDREEKLLKVTYNFKTKKGYFQAYKYLCFNKKRFIRIKAFGWLRERVNQRIFSTIECTEDAYKARGDFSIPKKVVVRTNNIGFFEVIDEIFKKEI